MQLAFLTKNKYIIINAFKTSLAMVIAYFVGSLFGEIFPSQSVYYRWMVITVLVVMSTQPNLGGALDKALMRFLGTLVGGFSAILIIFLFKNKSTQLFISVPFVIISVYFAGTVSKFSYAGVLACVTLAITIFNNDPSVGFAISRVVEISLGVIIALIVNRFVFPIRSEVRLRQSYVKTISQLKDFFDVSFSTDKDLQKELTETMFREFIKQMNLLKEIRYEDSKKVVKEYEKMGLYIRRLYRYTIIMYEYLENSTPKKIVGLNEAKAFTQFRKSIIECLSNVSKCINQHKKITHKELLDFEKDILPFLDKIKLLRDNEHFIFYTKIFVLNLRKAAIEYNYISQISKH